MFKLNNKLSILFTHRMVLLRALLLLTVCPVQAQEGFFYLIEELDTGVPLLRGTINQRGIPRGDLILSPNTAYRQWLLDPVTLFVGNAPFTTPANGRSFQLPPLGLQLPETGDTDLDGLHDIGEYIVGTSAVLADSDGDGIEDGAELENGLNPLDGLAVATGVTGGSDTPGDALGIHAFNETAIVADGAQGISIFNIFNAMNPILIGRVDTPGTATALHYSGDLVAVVDGSSGLAVIDIGDPSNAAITATLSTTQLSSVPRCVVTTLNLAYVGLASGKVAVVDMRTGGILQTLTVSALAIDDIGLAGNGLFVLTRNRLFIFDINTGLEARGDIAVSGNPSPLEIGLKLFVGGGRAYTGSFFGFSIYDVRDLDAPVLLGSPPSTQAGIHDLVSNGSGLALTITSFAGQSSLALSVYDDSDPTDVTRLITSFDTPGDARALTLSNGLAYVADTRNGMQIVNYRAFDSFGIPPTIALQPGFDIGAAEEGKLLLVGADVTDDVQVRNVSFFIDGSLAATIGSFPFEFRFQAPLQAQQSHLRIKARVFDTGGNMTETDELLVTLVADRTPPRVLKVSPAPASVLGSIGTVAALINEPLDPASLTSDRFFLTYAGPDDRFDTDDDARILATIRWDEAALGAFLSLNQPLIPGAYRATLTSGVTDVTGNSFVEAVTWGFRIFDIGEDRDGDGVPDDIEIALGLNPDEPDSDGDGLFDGDEDFDGDGISNRHEVILGTNPALVDSDQDGINDGDEDRDGDGLSDRDELLVHGTSLDRHDSDDDGFSDGDEVANDSNPLDPSSLPIRFAITPTLTILNGSPPAVGLGQALGRPMSVSNKEPPGVANGLAVGPRVTVRNLAEPERVAGQAESSTVMVENVVNAPVAEPEKKQSKREQE